MHLQPTVPKKFHKSPPNQNTETPNATFFSRAPTTTSNKKQQFNSHNPENIYVAITHVS